MDHTLDDYLNAATRENTRRSYQSAIRHFEEEWGGLLPASAETIAQYLVAYGSSHAVTTLRHRLAALGQWHVEHGFPDPTKDAVVRKVLRGIRAVHPQRMRQAKPVQLDLLDAAVVSLSEPMQLAQLSADHAARWRHTRDRAILLLGFWRGFRGDELTRLEVQHVAVHPGEGLTCYLPYSKTDRQHAGASFKVPALKRLCPVAAYQAWIDLSGLTAGPVFRKIDRAGHLGEQGLNPASISLILRRVFTHAGIQDAQQYTSHSLRRGLATWAADNGWDVQSLMEYVGWRSAQTAMRYIDRANPFAQQRFDSALALPAHGDID